MAGDIDPNEIAAKVVMQLAQNSVNVLSSPVIEKIRSLKSRFHIGFNKYIANIIKSYGNVKTIFSQDIAIPVLDLYVPVRLRSGEKEVTDSSLISELTSHKKIIVTGNAGTGKSMFLRHALIHVLSNYTYMLPVYLELRYFNESSTVYKSALSLLQASIPDMDEKIFSDGLRHNRFSIFLDGFDELPIIYRGSILREIMDLTRSIPDIIIVITTRPADAILSLNSFQIFHMLPFENHQVVSLINNTKPDHEKLKEFTKNLRGGVYDNHRDFISNPLLAIMMFITFSRVSEISNKMHIFYNDAFHVLVQWHDRSKGAYTREFKSGLDISSFRDLFSGFCACSYFDGKYVFSTTELSDYVKYSSKYYFIQSEPDELIMDLEESTSLLQRNGLSYTFVHRSFQEYFTAIFLKDLDDSGFGDAIGALLDRGETDNVLQMLREMQKARFDSIWVLPAVSKITKKYSSKNLDILEYLKDVPRAAIIRGNSLRFVFSSDNEDSINISAIRKLQGYNEVLGGIQDVEKDVVIEIAKILTGDGGEKLANVLRAEFGVGWEFGVRNTGKGKLPRGAQFELIELPIEVITAMKVDRLIRAEVRFLESVHKGLSRVEATKQRSLRQMLGR